MVTLCLNWSSLSFQPTLPGTIYTAAAEIEAAGGKALPCIVDVRDENQVKAAVQLAVKTFGGIDIVINNASAISMTLTPDTDMKRFDLMHQINTRGTFLVSKECLPYLKKSNHAHIVNLSPPLDMIPRWFEDHVAYTMAKFGMSMCVLGMASEFKQFGIGVNALWPQKVVQTSALKLVRGVTSQIHSRSTDIMADSAYAILIRDPKVCTGNFYIDEAILVEEGITDFKRYALYPESDDSLMADCFFCPEPENNVKPKL